MDGLFLFMATPLFVTVVGFFYWLYQDAKKQAVLRYLAIHRLPVNEQGNYDAFYDFQTDTYFRPDPGNTLYPAQYFLAPTGPATRNTHERPIVMTQNGYKASVLKPEQLERPEQEFEPEQLEQPETVRDFTYYLRQAKQNKVPKTKAIPAITGVTRGGSPAWNDWSEIWDNL